MLKNIIDKQKVYFNKNFTKDINFRKKQLHLLAKAINENLDEIYKALYLDLGKSEQEALTTEVSIVLSEINTSLKNLEKWTSKNKKKTPLHLQPSRSYTIFEPYGTVFILAPWNYPLQLSLAPLVGSIASGNTSVLEISSEAENTKNIVRKIIEDNFDEEYIHLIDNDVSYQEMMDQKYDYIFFTGSSRVAKIIMGTAAKRLIPLTLELGGKNPCFIDNIENIETCARKIAWGKGLNCGQTCVAPDYLLVNSRIKSRFVSELKKQIDIMYPDMINNDDYPKMINQRHFNRINELIEGHQDIIGGKADNNTNKIEMTILPGCDFNDKVMEDEIFGPVIPIIEYENIEDVINIVRDIDKPLACYVFSDNQEYIDKVMNNLHFGGGCINDVIMHIANDNLPFGGVGNSGMGKYHGYYSFKTFSYEKAITVSPKSFDIKLKYPPFKKSNLKLLYRLLKTDIS